MASFTREQFFKRIKSLTHQLIWTVAQELEYCVLANYGFCASAYEVDKKGEKKDPFWNNGMRNAALGMVSWREVTFEIRVNYCAEAAADGWGMLASSENGVPAALGTH